MELPWSGKWAYLFCGKQIKKQKNANEEESGTIDGMRNDGPRSEPQELQTHFDAINFDANEKETIHPEQRSMNSTVTEK